ncbi:hypothetical protein B0A67_14960 [Flavobacterium aquidurense]|jgi:hypothetical protein|uniref:DUF5071 domain-containing protein n=1 Tax=Flavobacterium aquidurense TaxID=362413 RepID=UPI000919CCF9|nr:DUF5071 domain-containing protein [Flavobacterium aquidurense]OXA70528.1 hypothetical protein B0A67_14960 [Flavobacterium aquidurense]SHG33037.1 protein of unknown function [Flavobacterium frigidimaris]
MDIKTLIPKDKFDYETVDRLKSCSYDQIESIIQELLEWLQDMNWPISQPIAEYLLPFSEKIAPEILKILQGKDEVWKYWMLVTFGKITKDKLVLEEINRIAKNPTQEETDNEVSEIANEIIN